MLRSLSAGLLAVLTAVPVGAQDTVAVSGSATRYPVAVSTSNGKQDVVLKLTGAALRTKLVINVYTIASYVQQGVTVRTADELIAADVVKLLSLVTERDVDGPDLIDAFKTSVGRTHPGRFGDEFNRLARHIGSSSAKKGSEVVIAYVPGSGTRFSFEGKEQLVIPGKEFADAVWGMYFGSSPVTDSVKKGLTSRLGR